MLSLEGLNRLCRHVIAAFVDRGPTDVDQEFNYREQLPGIVKMQLAPQYWIGRAEGFTVERAPHVLDGFLELLLETIPDPESKKLVNLSAVLEKVEVELGRTAKSARREPMVALYVLWHVFMRSDHHRPTAKEVIDRYQSDLERPGIIGFAVRVLASREIEWSLDELLGLVERRREDLQRGRGQPISTVFDAALLIATAMRLWDEGRVAETVTLVSQAAEAMPGNESLIALEDSVLRGEKPEVDLFEFLVGRASAENREEKSDGELLDA